MIMDDFLGGIGDDEASVEDEETLVSKDTTMLENIAIVTQFKCLERIKENSNRMYFIYECKRGKPKGKQKKGRLYENVKEIRFSSENLPKPEIDENGEGINVALKKLDTSGVQFLVRYLSYDSSLFSHCMKINQALTWDCDGFAVLSYLEKVLPRRKFFIRNLGTKASQIDDTKIKMVAEYFETSPRKAAEMINTIDSIGRADEFLALFEEGGSDGKKKKISRGRN